MAKILKHSVGVTRAGRWLLGTGRCGVVLMERACGGGIVIPDVIGWRTGGTDSHLVEVKVSRPDFFADNKKFILRNPGNGVGQHRYYLTPEDMVKPNEVPDKWGLLYCADKFIRVIKKAKPFEMTTLMIQSEMAMLYSAMRRVEIGAIVIREVSDGDED